MSGLTIRPPIPSRPRGRPERRGRLRAARGLQVGALLLLAAPGIHCAELPTGFSDGITPALPETEADSDSNSDSGDAVPAPGGSGITERWWRQPTADSQLQINSVHAGSTRPPAIVVEMSQPMPRDGGAGSPVGNHLAVYDPASGARIRGVWRVAGDPRILQFTLPGPGRYWLRLRAGLRDAAGHTLNRSLSGPVTVNPPPKPHESESR